MTSHTIKVNGKQMSVLTPDSEEVLMRELKWKWPSATIEILKQTGENK